MDQYIGRLLDDRYEILEVLGTGGMAVVYKARCHRLNRLVAIKILKDEFARDEEFRRRFHAEGEAVAMLSHPNIVQVYDVSSSDNANFIVMELIDGISLKQYMEKKGVLNWKETLHFAMQIAKGLEHAHSRGIVHRDIKPHNVMVLKNGSVKVMDFGIARVMNKSNTLTKEALGSVHYISPEQAKGGFTDNRSDLYSLSVVMYEMMTGRPPYDGESAVAVAIQHINGGAVMPSTLNPNIPGGLEQIIMKGMALELQDRYASATEMLQDMEEFRKNPGILFNYHSIIDDATRSISGISSVARTTAEKVVQAKTGVKPQNVAKNQSRVSSDSARLRPVSPSAGNAKRTSGKVGTNTGTMTRAEAARRARLRQQMEEKQREEERRARITTTAIVVCSAVAIIAIIAFLVALFNGALLNQENDYVEVPPLVGQMYGDDLMKQYDDFVILLQPQEYNDEHPKGIIIRQEPAAGDKVKKGSDLRITVSLGAEPEVKIMDDYIGYAQEGVKAALEGQGFKPIFREEASDIYKEGEIIRTDPVAGTELEEGQTIKIWVSTGPDVVLQKMPDVLGMELEVAENVLRQLGFDKIRTDTVESDKPKNTVVYQSEKHGDEIDVTTEILLEISEGPEETEPPTTEPPTAPPTTEPPTEPPMVLTNVTFFLPERDAMYVLTVFQGGVEVVSATQIQPGTTSYTVALSGIGTQSYDIYVDGIPYNTQTVEFSNG